MKKYFFISLIFLIHNIHAINIEPIFCLGSFGTRLDNKGNLEYLLEFPTVYLIDNDSYIGGSVNVVEFFIDSELADEDEMMCNFFKTSLFWTPKQFHYSSNSDSFILGPYISVGYYNEFIFDTGLNYTMFIPTNYIYDKIPKQSALKMIDLNLGYSLNNKKFYISLEADLLTVAIVFGISFTEYTLDNVISY